MKIFAVLALAVCLSGCPANSYHTAVVAEHDFTTALQSFQQAEIAEAASGRIAPAEHQRIEAAVGQIASSAQVLVTALQSSATNTTVQADFTTISNALNSLMVDGVFNVKNAQSQALLTTLVKSIQAILQNIGSVLSIQTSTPITPAVPKGGI